MSALPQVDWARLRELRARFLDAETRTTPGVTADYFTFAHDVELYDMTFAQRIGWKWIAALRELELRAPQLAPRTLLDWACGSGAAARAVLASPLGAQIERVNLWDRSQRAREYARRSLLELRPGLEVELCVRDGADLVVASHVLDELDEEGERALEAMLRSARACIVLESGAHASSRRLGALRARMLDEFTPLAPCPHREACGALALPTNWCHLFAKPPAEVFRDAFWAEFAREVGVDLRSLAYSFVALTRSSVEFDAAQHRILGRARLMKGRALLDACSREGVRTVSLLERLDRKLFKTLDEPSNEPKLWRLELDGARITALRDALETPRDG